MDKIQHNKLLYLPILLFIGVIIVGLLRKDTTTPTCEVISQDKAIIIVKALPEVKNYLSNGDLITKGQTSKADVDVDSETPSLYKVHVYSNEQYPIDGEMIGHVTTFNWYSVDKCTASIKCSFFYYDEMGRFVRASNGNEYPCGI